MAFNRLAVPRVGFRLHAKQLQQRWAIPSVRFASTTPPPPPPKPRVLEKPDKFRPPSHPSRIRAKPRYTGPPLSERERESQKTRRYPHMMPPEGSFMHWFLTNRSIHLWISLTVLCTLVFGIWFQNFVYNTPYRDLLPPNSMIFSHPFRFFGRWIEVYHMHVAYISQETAERRRRKVEDVKKRSEYRKAHGYEDQSVFGGWTAKTDEEAMGPAMKEGASSDLLLDQGSRNEAELLQGSVDGENETSEAQDTFIDFEGKVQPNKKKWFGIW